MGGLIASAACALANGAVALGGAVLAAGLGEVASGGGSSRAEWQISQAAQAKVWVGVPQSGLAVPWHAACAASACRPAT